MSVKGKARSPKSRSLRRGRGRGSILMVLGVIFAVSGLLRLGNLEMAQADEATPVAAIRPDADLGPTSALRAALDEVNALRARLDARERMLDQWAETLDAAQVLVEDRLAEMAAAEARLSRLVSVSDTAAESDLAQLTRVYETMDAREAAALFAQMQPSFAAGFLSRMTPAASAAILTDLDPEIAYAISLVLATRNATAPRLARDGTAGQTASPDTEN